MHAVPRRMGCWQLLRCALRMQKELEASWARLSCAEGLRWHSSLQTMASCRLQLSGGVDCLTCL